MPYIKQDHRNELYEAIDQLSSVIKKLNKENSAQTRDGLLNFSVTEILNQVYPDARYHDFNEIIGFLECCKLEYYRKKIGPYEDLKETENGPVRQFDKKDKSGY